MWRVLGRQALDANCSIATRVDYFYRSTSGVFEPMPSLTSYPADLVQTTTSEGTTVPYIVRVETGTIDRGIYETAILHDPTKEAPPTPFNPPAAWNHRFSVSSPARVLRPQAASASRWRPLEAWRLGPAWLGLR
jgi:hypothetical protein